MSAGAPGAARRIDPSVLRGPPLAVWVDGLPVTAFAGESVAGVLLAAGRRSGRHSVRRGEPRGYYCGMGVCYECTVRIDGRPGVRACMTEVAGGMRIETADGGGP